MICHKCNASVLDSAKFCPKCGGKILAVAEEGAGLVKVCPQCGANNAVGARFCKVDGYRFELGETPEAKSSNVVTPSNTNGKTGPAPEADETPGQSASSAEPLTPVADLLTPADPVSTIVTDPLTPVDGAVATAPSTASAALSPARTEDREPDRTVTCPRCGTQNLSTAKFCKKDGTLLSGASTAPHITAAPRKPPRKRESVQEDRLPPEGSRKKVGLIGVLITAMLLVAGSGGYLYWTGHIGDRQGSVAQSVNADLASQGFSNVTVSIDKDWMAAAEGTVVTSQEKTQALAVLTSHSELIGVVDSIRVRPTRAAMEQQLAATLAEAGIGPVTVQIDETLSLITVYDQELMPDLQAKAEQLLISTMKATGGVEGIKVVHGASVPSPTPLNIADLNAQFRSADLSAVSARNDSGRDVVLEGTVASKTDKDRAVQLSLVYPGVAGVEDRIEVTETAPPAQMEPPEKVTPSKPAPPPSQKSAMLDPAKLEGQINRALRKGGAGGVTAQVADNLTVTLKGAATSNAQKERAFQIARRFRGVKTVQDRVFVVQ